MHHATWGRATTSLGVLMLAACGTSRPVVVEEYTGTTMFTRGATLSSLSTDAAYRSAYVLLNAGSTRGSANHEVRRYSGQFCPEPPPDVMQAVSAAVTSALEGKVTPPAGAAGGEVGAEFGQALATSVAPLLQRSQGLQFFRDSMFYTCVAFLNGALQEEEYRQQLTDSAVQASALIVLELSTKTSQPADAADKAVLEGKLESAIDAIDRLSKVMSSNRPKSSGP